MAVATAAPDPERRIEIRGALAEATDLLREVTMRVVDHDLHGRIVAWLEERDA